MILRATAILLLLYLILPCAAQMDPRRLDSLEQQITEQAARLRRQQDSFVQAQDRLRQRQLDSIEKHKTALESIKQEQRSGNYLLLAGVMSALALLLAGLQRKKKKKQQP